MAKGGVEVNDLDLFIKQNKSKIREVSDKNTTRNKDSIIVLQKDDECRHEKEWDLDEMIQDIKKRNKELRKMVKRMKRNDIKRKVKNLFRKISY